MSNSNTEFPLQRPSVILTNFDIYENKTQLYIIGSNESEGHYRVLRVNRTTGDIKQMVEDDNISHSRDSIQKLVSDIQTKGVKLLVAGVCAILGFVRFTKGCYISIITKRRPVALLGGHYVYHVEDTRLLSIVYKPERSDAEEKCISRFKNVDLTKNFYYSHTYDITRTLQKNVQTNRKSKSTSCSKFLSKNKHGEKDGKQYYHSMFVWNYQLICNSTKAVGISAEWTVALIHGYVDQSRLSIFGRDVYITLIARRSRIFAGVRYLKRGINDAGYVANDVETEQIVNTMELTSFDMPYNKPFSNPNYTAYVQHRGSIPLFWSQETSGIAPKPPIEINVHDPYFVEAGRHFDNLFHRYGTPIIALNLIKTKERAKRESVLGEEYSEGLHYLNQFLPRGKKIRYLAWDMSRAKKNRQEDVLAILEVIAEETLTLTGFFHNGSELYSNYLKKRGAGDTRPLRTEMRRQTGVVRSNCIDCLDRTNAAQSIIGKVALAHQLFELGQIDEPFLSFNTDAAMIIEEMYYDLGNTIALQYGGSHLVNTVQTYRRNTNWRSHSRDIVESLRRYYSNSLLDMERQEAITHFVEKCLFSECSQYDSQSREDRASDDGNSGDLNDIPAIADHSSKTVINRPNQVGKPVFRRWWTTLGEDEEDSENIHDVRSSDPLCGYEDCTPGLHHIDKEDSTGEEKDGYWSEYYRPHEYTSFDDFFIGNLNSSASLYPNTDIQNIPSPFSDRGGRERRSAGGRVRRYVHQKPKWLKSEYDEYSDPTQVSREDIYNKVCAKATAPPVTQPMEIGGWITDGVSSALQEPRVSQVELEEYEKYVHQFDDLKQWIVPSSNVLYSDYIKNRQDSIPVNSFDMKMVENSSLDYARHTAASLKQQSNSLFGPLKIGTASPTAKYLFNPDAEQRLQTPVPRRSVQLLHAPHSATASRSHLYRLFGLGDIPAQENISERPKLNRHRSNTASHERGTLWSLWQQNGVSEASRSGSIFGKHATYLTPTSVAIAPRASFDVNDRTDNMLNDSPTLNHIKFRDRSRSLDLTNFGAVKFPLIATGADDTDASGAALVPEPRITEADLRIYQDYVRMRKAFGS